MSEMNTLAVAQVKPIAEDAEVFLEVGNRCSIRCIVVYTKTTTYVD
jgi:hypothetical protein